MCDQRRARETRARHRTCRSPCPTSHAPCVCSIARTNVTKMMPQGSSKTPRHQHSANPRPWRLSLRTGFLYKHIETKFTTNSRTQADVIPRSPGACQEAFELDFTYAEHCRQQARFPLERRLSSGQRLSGYVKKHIVFGMTGYPWRLLHSPQKKNIGNSDASHQEHGICEGLAIFMWWTQAPSSHLQVKSKKTPSSRTLMVDPNFQVLNLWCLYCWV